jgi:signal transduction histidine kinase
VKGSIVRTVDRRTANDQAQRERALQRESDFHAVLLAMAGHDLRQPLQVMMNAYDWLSRRLDSASEQEYLHRGTLAITQLTKQLDILVDALRLHERAPDIGATPVALRPLLSRLRCDHEQLAIRKGLMLRLCPSEAAVMSDPVLLEGILRNLVRNALKYTRPGGQILVGCRPRGALVRIEVHDTGVGIPPEKLARVFDAFHRLDSTRAEGLGLGLFVVRRAVDLLGHRIEVRSTVGRGSCFSILAASANAAKGKEHGSLRGLHGCGDGAGAGPLCLPHLIGDSQ